MSNTFIAVEQHGHAFYGCGTTADEAIEDATKHVDPETDLTDVDFDRNAAVGVMRLVRVTADLMAAIKIDSQCTYETRGDGVLCTKAEHAEANA